MRKIAKVKNDSNVKRVMIYSCKDGVYLFLYKDNKDSPSYADYWFEDIKDAEEVCTEDYGLTINDWQIIDDPLPDCQHDIIATIRVKGRNLAKPEWGKYEKLEDGKWQPFEFK